MSNIGKKPIKISSDISVLKKKNILFFKKEKKLKKIIIPKQIKFEVQGSFLFLKKPLNKLYYKYWGLYRNLIQQIIYDLKIDSLVVLKVYGMGYKVLFEDNILSLKLGYSHLINIKIKQNITIDCNENIIKISGSPLQEITQFASKLKELRVPNSYTGKGIHYIKDKIIFKEGKKKK